MITMSHVYYPKIGTAFVEHALVDDLVLDQWIIPKGTLVKTKQTANFGWLLLPADCKDKRGFPIPRRLHKH